jgi:hypothetical protein
MNPSVTLREIAALTGNTRIQKLATQLAEEFEHQHNRQNNAFQVALGHAELGWDDRLTAFRNELTERLENTDARQIQMLAMLEDLQTELRALAHRIGSASEVGDGR